MKQMTGRHVFGIFAFAFGTIIAVNMTLAFAAVRSFPGLEVKNSYVASQAFQAQRTAQEALGWDVSATLDDDRLTLRFTKDGVAVIPEIETAVFGRATAVSVDQVPEFALDHGAFTARVDAGPGNWNLRVAARAMDGTPFKQRVVVEVVK